MSQQPIGNPGQPGFDFVTPEAPRRGFVKQFLAIVIGSVVGVVPMAVGLATFLNPLRKSAKEKQRPVGMDEKGFYKVVPLSSLSETPQALKIIADRKDAWNTFPKEGIGAVYLQRVGTDGVLAFNAECPHLGCLVDYRPSDKAYLCPCHNSLFAADGKRDPKSPSARDLDKLEAKVEDGIVWVRFLKFKTGDKEMVPA